jgi:Tol biopolymer transport system component
MLWRASRRIRPHRVLILAAALLLAWPEARGSAASASPRTPNPEEKRLARDFHSAVKALASDRMEGRGLDTGGIRRAAAWIEARLREYGLKPAFAGSYRQPFPVKIGVKLAEGNRLEGVAASDWTPLAFSSSGGFAGEVCFAGYGIEAPALGFRELEPIDVKGKVVLMLRYEPQEKDEASPFAGKRPSRFSGMRYKVLQARERGAVAVVFVPGPLQDEGQDKLPALRNDGPESPAGIPVLQVRTSLAQRWLASAGIDLEDFQKSVDRDLTPRSRDSIGLRLSGRITLDATYATTENLAGIIPGRGDLAREVVVLGAHYDHLGYGGPGSLRPNQRAIHNGADDNASGTAAVLLAGRDLARRLEPLASRRTVVIALFSAEETGLAGSSHFVANPPFPDRKTVAMINLDMVGRLHENRLGTLGADSAPEWRAAIEQAARAAGIEAGGRGDGYGPSDQTSFYSAGIPVLHLFTGAHDAYHTPDDDPHTIDAAGGAKVTAFTAELASAVASGPVQLTYARSTAGPAMAGDSRGYGAYLGTVPDYRAMEATEGGVLLADVRPGGPAELAGIRGGDRIVEVARTRIENLYDLTYALQDHKPGETVTVVVVREGAKQSFLATLGDRAALGRETAAASPAGGPAELGGAGPAPGGASKPGPATAPPAAAAPPLASAPAPQAAAAPPPAPTVPAPTSPHEAAAFPEEPEEGIDPFYADRPGAEFRIGAGKPFAKTHPGERHLAEIRQLTFGGENAEAYFSPDGKHLIFQATVGEKGCDQQYVMDLATGDVTRVSTGKGRTTCGYFDWPEADRIVYASTHETGEACPPPPDRSRGYVWALYAGYDIYEARPDGSGVKRLTGTPGYDAEATWCHRGGKLVFTSIRDGDLDLYEMDEAGEMRRLTHETGYDGGAFYSPDCSEIVWRASRPQGDEEEEYRRLLADGLIRPNALEIYVMKADGTGVRQITANGAANFCPVFTADGKKILFSSNAGSGGGREFDLWIVGAKGGQPERVTFAEGFDGFPQMSPDGRYLVWASNRADPAGRETNLFLARWVD